jgi:hypothetical protein
MFYSKKEITNLILDQMTQELLCEKDILSHDISKILFKKLASDCQS